MKKIGAILGVSLLLFSLAASDPLRAAAQARLGFKEVRRDRPFPLSRQQAPDEAGQLSFERTHCADLENGLRICKIISDTETIFALERNGQRLGQWPTAIYNGGASRFEVLQGDLDGDRVNEIIVANCYGVTNGIGIEYWTISILPDPEKHGFQPPLNFSVEEYGRAGTFVHHPGDRRCHIFATEWQEFKDSGRKWGLYLTGRWFRYQSGLLVPIKERAVLARRYRFTFENQRDQATDDARRPLHWFQHRSTEIRRRDPQVTDKKLSSVRAVVIDATYASGDAGEEHLRIKVKTSSGRIIDYVESFAEAEDGEQAKNHFQRLGDLASGIVYPKGYAPAATPHWLAGKRVRIVTYQHQDGEPNHILWVD